MRWCYYQSQYLLKSRSNRRHGGDKEKDLGNCEHLLLNYWTNENPPRITHSYDPTKPIIVRINSGCTWSPQTLENEKVIAKELREFIEQVKTNPDVESMSLCTGDYGVVLPTYRREQK